MHWLDRLSAKKGVVGIELFADSLAIVAKGCHGASADECQLIDVIQLESEEDTFEERLAQFVGKHKLANHVCHVVLSRKDYQLLLVEAPDVAPDQLRAAVRWKIKDLITTPLDKAVIEVFNLPADANKSGKKMVYVVVSPLERVKWIIDLINESGLTLASIDIHELAFRNLAWVSHRDLQARGVGIVRLYQGGGLLSLYREGNLYLSRQFKLDYNAGLLDEIPADALSLEVQRSLDYYERQMGLSPPAGLFICGDNVSEDKVTEELNRSITVPAHFLAVNDLLQSSESIDEGLSQLCIGALGAVYREGVIA